MRRVVVVNNLTLDGVMQAPGRPDEDVRGGFKHGGWALPYNDEVMGKVMGEGMAQGGPLLFGRRTYEDFYRVWPKRKDNPFTEVLNNVQKFVASTTLKEPLPWSNSTLLDGDAADGVTKLKTQPGKDLSRSGSGSWCSPSGGTPSCTPGYRTLPRQVSRHTEVTATISSKVFTPPSRLCRRALMGPWGGTR